MFFDLPINSVSFGQTSWNILQSLKKKGLGSGVFPYNEQVDLSSFKDDTEFTEWLVSKIKDAPSSFSREEKVFKLWHIRGSIPSYSKHGNDLLTFHETDSLTDVEVNVLKAQRRVIVTSKYTQGVFAAHGIQSDYHPLGFDSFHFEETQVPRPDGVEMTFGLFGKLEKRKHTIKTMIAWAKAFGGDKRYRLNCSIGNVHLDLREQAALISASFGGRIPWNINLLPITPKNSDYNKVLNSVDVVLGTSGCEGFNLPLFQCMALGKGAIVLNEHVHKDYCNDKNSVLIPSNGEMIDADDGKFFIKGLPYNQGKWYDWDESIFIDALKSVAEAGKTDNVEGRKLAGWSYDSLVDTILS